MGIKNLFKIRRSFILIVNCGNVLFRDIVFKIGNKFALGGGTFNAIAGGTFNAIAGK